MYCRCLSSFLLVMTSSVCTWFACLKAHTTLFFCLMFLVPCANSLQFEMPSFGSGVTTMVYEGAAVTSAGSIELTDRTDYLGQVGRATYVQSMPLWDSGTGRLSDFSTHFTFSIDTEGRSLYGDGLAFFLAPVGFQIPPNSAGGFLGLFNFTTHLSPLNQIVFVEFDSFPNPEWEPKFEHVGINNNSIPSVVTAPWNTSFHSGDTADAWITYNATTKNLSVFWSYKTEPNYRTNSSLWYQIDLSKVLPEWVSIGFSAATGTFLERHTIRSWEFSSSLEMTKKSGKHERIKKSLKVGIAVSILCALAAGGIVAYVVLAKKRRQAKRKTPEGKNLTSINDDLERGAGPRRFSYKDIVSATNNFSAERKLGEGGFGGVYRGYLNDLDMAVAVKKISRASKQGKKEYVTEVKIFSRLRHRNLVQLIGWCHEKGEFLLIYEYMPKGSLDSHLFGKKRAPLTWGARYKITLGLASALLYLHEEWEQCVVHRDIKSSNIMLDSGFGVKLGDFGLARLMDHELGPQTTGLAGTLGYMAPENISTGKASKESDVYSFGVVTLEIVTGKKATKPIDEDSGMGLVEWVWDVYGRGEVGAAVDERLEMEYDVKQLECMVVVGLWCAHPDRSARPWVRQAIQVLNFEAAMPNLPTKMPVPTYHVPTRVAPPVSSGEPFLTNTSMGVGR